MKKHSIYFALIGFCTLAMGSAFFSASAGSWPSGKQLTGAAKTFALPVGCGWDYPCPPVRAYPRPRVFRQPGVYIQNNYGTVNIEAGRWVRREPSPALPPACCDTAATAPAHSGWPASCGPEPCGYEPSKEDDCGVRCWWRRFREGYCGHGCWAYREQARAEADEKERKEDRRAEIELESRQEQWYGDPYSPFSGPAYVPPAAPAPRFERRDQGVQRPQVEERAPLGRFEGPKYPVD